MATGLFSKLWPKEVRFFKGEQPTSTKLNGAFRQIENAFFMLESFLGNGTDNGVTDTQERKLLFNISNAIGSTDKLYKPSNKVTDLDGVSKKFGRTTGQDVMTHDHTTDTLNVDPTAYDITIPVNALKDDVLSIYYSGDGRVMVNGSTYVVLPNKATYGWHTIVFPNTINFIRIAGVVNGATFRIRSLSVSSETLDVAATPSVQRIANKAYSIPLSNSNYWTMKVPCKFSRPTATGADKCADNVRTCDYCIGNTYEYDITSPNYGMPKCVGALSLTATAISYEPETLLTDEQRAGYLTIQSPLVTVSRKYETKLKPILVNKEKVDIEIGQNKCIIYDTKNPASTIKYTTKLFSAGRGDILYVKDSEIFKEFVADTKRYLVLSEYGLTDLMYDMMDFHEVQMPIDAYPVNVAVYDDES